MNLQLKNLRNLRGLSQDEMAEKLCIKTSRYGTWERGERMLSFEQAIACAEVLGCTTDELAGRKPIRSFTDPTQAKLNASYENMNEQGKETLISVARSMEKDTANRILKDRQERYADQSAIGA